MQNYQEVFNLNGVNYAAEQLTQAGQELLSLLNDAQNELSRLEKQKLLLQAGQQQLIYQLKQILPPPIPNQSNTPQITTGKASRTIPTTSVDSPKIEPAPFPELVPESIRPKSP